jgi:hypothetical protein
MKKILFIFYFICAFAPARANAITILVESESFTSYHDIVIDAIHSETDSGCTGGYFLDGFDYENEWVEYEINVNEFGFYAIQLRVRGYSTDNLYEVMLTGHPSGNTQSTTIPWEGIGKG